MRGRQSALRAASLDAGAVITWNGDALVERDLGVVDRLVVASGSLADDLGGDRMVTPYAAALSRGGAWIVPLAWTPEHANEELVQRAHELWMGVRSAAEYRHGAHLGVVLEGRRGAERLTAYASELQRTGVRRADWWAWTERTAIVLVVHGDPVPAPSTRMALHVVPIEWVSERPAARGRVVVGDLDWSWRDVVDVGGQRTFDLGPVRYPKRLEHFRLEAVGKEPRFHTLDEAHAHFDRGGLLSVIPVADPPGWRITASGGGRRLAITFFTERKTPLREIVWEADGEVLVLRRTIDVFYPKGDPGRRIRFDDLPTVTRDSYRDSVVHIAYAAPGADGTFDEIVDPAGGAAELPVPAFGAWEDVLAASVPDDLPRFGPEAASAAPAYATHLRGTETRRAASTARGWRVAASGHDGVMRAVEDALAGDLDAARVRMPVIERG